jgi:hypothetical protein
MPAKRAPIIPQLIPHRIPGYHGRNEMSGAPRHCPTSATRLRRRWCLRAPPIHSSMTMSNDDSVIRDSIGSGGGDAAGIYSTGGGSASGAYYPNYGQRAAHTRGYDPVKIINRRSRKPVRVGRTSGDQPRNQFIGGVSASRQRRELMSGAGRGKLRRLHRG